MKQFNLPYPEAIFEIGFFRQQPEAFYRLAREFLLKMDAKPILAHKWIKKCEENDQLLYCFTQNIDGLELDAGLKE